MSYVPSLLVLNPDLIGALNDVAYYTDRILETQPQARSVRATGWSNAAYCTQQILRTQLQDRDVRETGLVSTPE